MDLWVVAAAAGAGYIAKNLQNLSSVDKKESLIVPSLKHSHNVQSGSRNLLQQFRETTCPLRRLARKTAHDDINIDYFSEFYKPSHRNKEAGLDENRRLEDHNMGSVSGSREPSLDTECRKSGNFNRSIGCRVDSLRPLKSSLGSWLDERMMDDRASFYSSVTTIRPLMATDATRIISRSGSDSTFLEFDGCRDEARREHIGVSLEQFESVEEVRKPKMSFGDLEPSGSSKEAIGGSIRAQGLDKILVFITGMILGILFTATAWKTEVDKLNNQIKQMQSLVQDLHEELDMKEMLMVNDLTDEGYLHARENDTPATIHEPTSSPSRLEMSKSENIDHLRLNADDRDAENLELLSKIEAELQAELEMLENNMKASSLERISSVVELDPDFEPDIVQGELKSTTVNAASNSESETPDTTKTNHSQPANYVVSPWDLSFRLHELIESRLAMRINELETALANSQNGAQILHSDNIYGETEYSSWTRDEHDKTANKDEQRSASFGSDEDRASNDEGSDEFEMILIKQIIERRKMGASLSF